MSKSYTGTIWRHYTGFSELKFQQALVRISARYPMKAIHHKGLIRTQGRGIVATRLLV